MSPEILATIGMGLALAALTLFQMAFSELDALSKRVERLEWRFENRSESLDLSNMPLAQRAAYLEGLTEGRSLFERTKRRPPPIKTAG